MNTTRLIIVMALLSATATASTERFVAQAGQTPDTNSPPTYTSWATAASNIQEVVNIANSGDVIRISNGVYRATAGSVVSINQSLSLIGEGPREAVIIDGEDARRGIVISLSSPADVRIEGLTVAHGLHTHSGGGIVISHDSITSGSTTIHDCVIVSNTVTTYGSRIGGAGIHSFGASGSEFVTEISRSRLAYNDVAGREGGGGIYFRGGGVQRVIDCLLEHNVFSFDDGSTGHGGAAIRSNNASEGSVIRNSRIVNNTVVASGFAGGIYLVGGAPIENCIIQSNSAANAAGVYIQGAAPVNVIRNSLISHNHSRSWGGGVGTGTSGIGLIENCTIVDNTGDSATALYIAYSASNTDLYNTIVYGTITGGRGQFLYSRSDSLRTGEGNIDADAAFVDRVGGNYRLASGSPCINTGTNLPWMASAVDLDGRPRIDVVAKRVDMGAYEFAPPGTLLLVR